MDIQRTHLSLVVNGNIFLEHGIQAMWFQFEIIWLDTPPRKNRQNPTPV